MDPIRKRLVELAGELHDPSCACCDEASCGGSMDDMIATTLTAGWDAYKQEQALDNLTAQAQEHNMGYDD